MAISKIILNGVTQIDLTSDTVADASHIRNGYVGHLNDGEQETGTYTGGGSPALQAKTNISPTTSSQTIEPDSGYDGLSSVQINAMPAMTLPSASSATSSGTSKATITPGASAQYLNIPTGYNETAQYYTVSAMPSMTLPTASSATSSGTSKATITPGASAQYLNIPTGYNATEQYYTIAAASGGASNFVTGTFKGTTTGAAMDVTLNYSGSGYPVAVMIYPKEGAYNSTTGTWDSLVQRYAIGFWTMSKSQVTTTPSYSSSGIDDYGVVLVLYKSSASNATSYSRTSSMTITCYRNSTADSTNTGTYAVKIRSSTKMSVYIASSSYGFAANVEYAYHVIYSS